MSASRTMGSGSAASAPPDAAPRTAAGGWDWWLLATSFLVAGFGLLMILSASSVRADAHYGDALHFVARQGAGLLLGVAAATVVLWSPWKWLRRAAWPAYLGAVVMLALVMTPLGHGAMGAERWISVGGIHLQPSELAKVAVILVMAHYLAANEGRLGDLVGTVLPGLAVAAPAVVLVLLEPDFGTTVLLCGLVGVLFFVAGLRLRWLAALGSASLASLAVIAVLAPYRVRRLVAFRDPYADPDDAGYQVVQGWIAMAHGALTGQGLGTGVAQSGFLPEAHNDFIAAVVAEELGGVGWCVLIAAQIIIVWRGTRIAANAPDLFGTLLASGLTALLGFQAIVNLGVVVGWLPNKGLVLPFVSYGASAAVVHTLCVGLLLRIALEGRPARLEGHSS